jgi:prefoldin subunit 4
MLLEDDLKTKAVSHIQG